MIWRDLDGTPANHAQIITRAAVAPVVLLGERHDRADHHRWQAWMVAALAGRRDLVVGFEMFPASADPVLQDWVAGELSEAEFLEQVGWKEVWGFDSDLYMPIFRLCRELRLPMVGLNVPRSLVRAVGKSGWEGVPENERHGLTPAHASAGPYRQFIFDLTGGQRDGRAARSGDDPALDGFVRAQEVWDRAFATHIHRAHHRQGKPLVVGIIGMGHLQYGGGVSWQLADLGLDGALALIPQDSAEALPTEAQVATFHLAPVIGS